MSVTFPFTALALRVAQPLGAYYVTVLPAELLLTVCFSDKLRARKEEGGTYFLDGTQRAVNQDRLKAIGSYISRSDSAFPNSLIVAANSRADDGFIEEDDTTRWTVKESTDGSHFELTIPTKETLSAIIDGQHRLFAFTKAAPERLSMPLICSVYFDLPKPFQAQLFATINSTQKPVDKSLTYELFGYNISDEPEAFWSPEKLAVFFARRLNTEDNSPLKGRVAIAPENDFLNADLTDVSNWHVSMATVVEGILRLISNNPKRDSNELLDPAPRKREALGPLRDNSPLRQLYLDQNDKLIYLVVSNYLTACDRVLWSRATAGSFIIKTVGIQALFDVLREMARDLLFQKNVSLNYFTSRLGKAGEIDFSTPEFRNASGSGRTEIKRAIRERMD